MDDRVLSQRDIVERQVVPDIDLPGSAHAPGDLTFAELLQRLRLERGWTKADLAKRAGFDPSSITRFEQGARAPERDTVIQLANAMVLPVSDRDRLLASAGFRSELWDDPLLVELAQILGDTRMSAAAKNEVRTVLRMAIAYCKLQRLDLP